jgi:hypothetical protein
LLIINSLIIIVNIILILCSSCSLVRGYESFGGYYSSVFRIEVSQVEIVVSYTEVWRRNGLWMILADNLSRQWVKEVRVKKGE